MAHNLKSIIMGRNREGIDHEMKKKHPSLAISFGLLNQFINFTTLSRKNILWAARHVQTLREHVDWINDVPSQEKLDRLDQAVAAAKERLRRRDEKRDRIKAVAESKEPKVDGRRKVVEPLTPVSPVDQGDLLKRLLAQQQQQKEKS